MDRSYFMLQMWTPKVVTLWEALLTVLMYGLLLIHAYAQDKFWPYISLPLYALLLLLPPIIVSCTVMLLSLVHVKNER